MPVLISYASYALYNTEQAEQQSKISSEASELEAGVKHIDFSSWTWGRIDQTSTNLGYIL